MDSLQEGNVTGLIPLGTDTVTLRQLFEAAAAQCPDLLDEPLCVGDDAHGIVELRPFGCEVHIALVTGRRFLALT